MPKAAGGQVKPYGVAISDALNDPKSSLESLAALRESARRLLKEQGDLPGALKKLEAEIARRGKK
ncbi:MAG: hypothetical protein JWO81_457 [Alphaproteobacteria bacterium]|nr:hypothetical protein [Alphaproteobacteria bacterium]